MHGEFLSCTGRVASWYGTLFLCAAIRFFFPFCSNTIRRSRPVAAAVLQCRTPLIDSWRGGAEPEKRLRVLLLGYEEHLPCACSARRSSSWHGTVPTDHNHGYGTGQHVQKKKNRTGILSTMKQKRVLICT